MKSRSRESGCFNDRVALKFDRHLDSPAAEVHAKFQSDWKSLNPNLAASRSCGKTSVRLVNRGPEYHSQPHQPSYHSNECYPVGATDRHVCSFNLPSLLFDDYKSQKRSIKIKDCSSLIGEVKLPFLVEMLMSWTPPLGRPSGFPPWDGSSEIQKPLQTIKMNREIMIISLSCFNPAYTRGLIG